MRILHIHNYYQSFGGEDRAVDNERELLEREGNEIIRYARHNDEIKSFTLWQKLLFFPAAFYSRKTCREVARLIDEKKPEIAHVHNVFPLISPSVYFCLKRKGVPVIQTVHNFRFLCPAGLFYARGRLCEKCATGNTLHCLWRKCYKESFVLSALYALVFLLHRGMRTFQRKVDLFITLNNFTRAKLAEHGFAYRAISILGNFFPDAPAKTGCRKEEYAVYLGRLAPEKGMRTMLEAFKAIGTFKLKIVGTGELEPGIREFIAQGSAPNVELTGFIAGEKRLEILRKARFSIMPSQCYENFPIAVLESFAERTPVIASRIGGLPELVEEGKSGLLFEPGDPADLADKIRFMLRDPVATEAMGEYAYGCVRENYGAGMHYTELLDIYRKAIENR